MYILAFQLGHNATVSLYENNSILEVVSEEKFDNIKNSSSLTTKSANKSTDSNKKVAQLINSKTAIKDSKIEKSELSSKKLSIKKNPKNTKSTIKSSAKSDAKKRNQKNIKNTKSSTK